MTINPDTDLADELLAVRCQLGERAAFDELIDRWHGPLWTYVRRLIGKDEEARELIQEVWIRVLRGIPRLRDGAKLRAWLFGIARRTVMDRLRVQYATPAEADVDLSEMPAETWASRDEGDLQELEHALARLPAVERDILTLFYLEELSLNHIAEAIGIPIGTVKSRLFRARRLLRQEMHAGGSRT